MIRLVYLKKGEEPPAPFRLYEYAEPDGGRLHGPSTLAKLRLATLEAKVPGIDVYVPVAFHTGTELSIDRFTANSEETPLAVRGEGVAGAAGAAGVAGAAGATGPAFLTALDNLTTQLKTIVRLQTKIYGKQYHYTSSQATKFRDPAFKETLIQEYGASGENDTVFCTLLGAYLPRHLVCASHLFKYAWRMDVQEVLSFSNINDPRNGLLLLKPLEEAYDNGFLVFEARHLGEEQYEYIAHWLGGPQHDQLKLADFKKFPWMSSEKLSEDYQKNLRESCGCETFKSLEGKLLTFKTGARPFKRCLAFHATQCIRQAVAEGRITKSWLDGKDFHTFSPAATNVERYLASIPASGADAPEAAGDQEDLNYDGTSILSSEAV